VKIDGVLHEFSSIPGVKEDVTEIIMNIKSLSIKNSSETNEPKTAYIDFEGEGPVRASDIQCDHEIRIMNPDQVIAKSVILDRISMDTPDCTDSSLRQHISNLRKKLRDAGGEEYIEAIWGIGFKLGVASN